MAGSSRSTTMPSIAPTTMSARWRWSISKAGSRAAGISRRGICGLPDVERRLAVSQLVGRAKTAPVLTEHANRCVDLLHHDRDAVSHIARIDLDDVGTH